MNDYGVELSDKFKSIWGMMLKSKESAAPANSIWEGLVRVNRLTSEYIKEMYGEAAICIDGRYFTPDCKVLPKHEPSASERRRKALAGKREC